MNREQLRAQLLANADQASNSILWRWMTPAQRNLLIAGRQVNSQDAPAVNAYLDLVLAHLNTMQTPVEAAPPVPMPPTDDDVSIMLACMFKLVAIVKGDPMA